MTDTTRFESIAERLEAVEEELRDLAYERLSAAASGEPEAEEVQAARADEKRLLQARRAVARAIAALRQG